MGTFRTSPTLRPREAGLKSSDSRNVAPLIATPSNDRSTLTTDRNRFRWILWLAITGPVLFFIVFTIDGAFTPGYSPTRDAVSYLALGPHGWIQTLNFAVLGVIVMLFAYAFFRWWRWAGSLAWITAASVLLGFSGVGFLLAAIFPAARPPQPPGPLHTMAFETVFFGQGLACLIFGLNVVRLRGWRLVGYLSIAIAVLTVVPALGNLSSLISAAPVTPISSPNRAFALGGLFNRIVVGIAFIWYLMTAGTMLRRTNG